MALLAFEYIYICHYTYKYLYLCVSVSTRFLARFRMQTRIKKSQTNKHHNMTIGLSCKVCVTGNVYTTHTGCHKHMRLPFHVQEYMTHTHFNKYGCSLNFIDNGLIGSYSLLLFPSIQFDKLSGNHNGVYFALLH